MKQLIAIAILIAGGLLVKRLFKEYDSIQKRDFARNQPTEAVQPAGASSLEGMPASLESTYQTAYNQGPAAVKTFLQNYRHHIRDPRLAEIELDYVVRVSLKDTAEAKQVFQAVKNRTPLSSPVYERIKKLEGTFQ